MSEKISKKLTREQQRELDIKEQDAYLALQKESRQRRKSMRESAEAILLHDEIKGDVKQGTTKSRS